MVGSGSGQSIGSATLQIGTQDSVYNSIYFRIHSKKGNKVKLPTETLATKKNFKQSERYI